MDIDILRALGILFVVMYHDATVPYVWPIGYWLRSLMSTCVPIFFFSSGLVLAKREDPLRTWVYRLLRTFCAAVILGFASGVYFSATTGEPSIEYALVSFLSFRTNETVWLWFLQSLFLVYLCAPALIALKKNRPDLWFPLVAIVLVLSFGGDLVKRALALEGLSSNNFIQMVRDYFMGFNPLNWDHPEALGYFVVGMSLSEWDATKHSPILDFVGVALAPVPLMFYGLTMSQSSDATYDIIWNGYGCVTTLLAVIALFALASRLAPKVGRFMGGLFRFVGANTFFAYAFNWFVTQPVRPFMATFDSLWSRLLGGTAISLAIVLTLSAVGQLFRLLGNLLTGPTQNKRKTREESSQ
ncbi:MAG: acyltransferase [Atopobiaceae bacterium]